MFIISLNKESLDELQKGDVLSVRIDSRRCDLWLESETTLGYQHIDDGSVELRRIVHVDHDGKLYTLVGVDA